jgi:hypothetical protein
MFVLNRLAVCHFPEAPIRGNVDNDSEDSDDEDPNLRAST